MVNHTISTQQQRLLKAALLSPELALSYWQTWQHQQRICLSGDDDAQQVLRLISRIDRDSQRLLPLIYRNLLGASDAFIPHLRGLYRGTWLKNQKHLLKAQTLITSLQSAGIDVIMLKGIPLSMQYYGDMGVRMTSDIDLLVPTDCADKALQVLQNPVYGLQATAYETKHRRILHAMHLFDPNGVDVDLHWNLMYHHAYPGADIPFWADKQPITLPNGTVSYTLSPTHQVFHNLVHGFHWGQSPAIRWIPDTCVICLNKTAVDWPALIDLSEQYNMRIPVQQGLQLLMAEFGLIVPDAVRDRLNTLSVSAAEQTYIALLSRSSSNALSKSIRYVRKNELAYRLFRRGKSGLSLSQYLWDHLQFRIDWKKRDLPF